MPDDDGGSERAPGGSGPWMSRSPDPTTLTTEAVDRATKMVQMELGGIRAMHDKDLAALKATWDTRVKGIDQQRQLLWDEIHNWPAVLEPGCWNAAGSLRTSWPAPPL